MKRLFMLLIAGSLLITSCSEEQTNTLLAEWDTPFETPPFEKIKTVEDTVLLTSEKNWNGLNNALEILKTKKKNTLNWNTMLTRILNTALMYKIQGYISQSIIAQFRRQT